MGGVAHLGAEPPRLHPPPSGPPGLPGPPRRSRFFNSCHCSSVSTVRIFKSICDVARNMSERAAVRCSIASFDLCWSTGDSSKAAFSSSSAFLHVSRRSDIFLKESLQIVVISFCCDSLRFRSWAVFPGRQTSPICICAHSRPGKNAARKIHFCIKLLLVLLEQRIDGLRRQRFHRLLHR